MERLLNDHSARTNSPDAKGRTPLSYSAESRSVETVGQILANQDTDWNNPDNDGKYPLYYAVTSGNDKAATMLVERI
jgi:ankyrin repeat protein